MGHALGGSAVDCCLASASLLWAAGPLPWGGGAGSMPWNKEACWHSWRQSPASGAMRVRPGGGLGKGESWNGKVWHNKNVPNVAVVFLRPEAIVLGVTVRALEPPTDASLACDSEEDDSPQCHARGSKSGAQKHTRTRTHQRSTQIHEAHAQKAASPLPPTGRRCPHCPASPLPPTRGGGVLPYHTIPYHHHCQTSLHIVRTLWLLLYSFVVVQLHLKHCRPAALISTPPVSTNTLF